MHIFRKTTVVGLLLFPKSGVQREQNKFLALEQTPPPHTHTILFYPALQSPERLFQISSDPLSFSVLPTHIRKNIQQNGLWQAAVSREAAIRGWAIRKHQGLLEAGGRRVEVASFSPCPYLLAF